jgi:hypothetical protein
VASSLAFPTGVALHPFRSKPPLTSFSSTNRTSLRAQGLKPPLRRLGIRRAFLSSAGSWAFVSPLPGCPDGLAGDLGAESPLRPGSYSGSPALDFASSKASLHFPALNSARAANLLSEWLAIEASCLGYCLRVLRGTPPLFYHGILCRLQSLHQRICEERKIPFE